MKYDTIIVGAESAVAVLLLEAGRDYPDLDQTPTEVKYSFGPNLTPARRPGVRSTSSCGARLPPRVQAPSHSSA